MKTREIKFRAWNKYSNEMIYSDKEGWSLFGDCVFDEDDVYELMQFTGLKDENGVEIYEDDYLVDRYPIDDEDLSLGYNESLLPVVWCKDTLSWCIDASFNKDGGFLTSLVEYFGEFLEVKGNIHENKNLL